MEAKSLEQLLAWHLRMAEVEYKTAVLNQKANDADWADWYASWIAKKLTPTLAEVQGICELAGR